MSRLRLITAFLFAIFMVLGVTAQVHTQKGIVRKITRSASDPFIPVPGVQVVVSGQANKASDKDGRFSLEVRVTDKAGSYTLTAVRMPQGSKYILASPLKGKRLFVSANDLEVSLVTPEEKDMEYKKRYELLKEKYEEQSLSLRKLRNELNKRLGELSESDVHYARLKVECDSIRKLYLDYINNEDKIDEVIKELAEELALTDYQSLDSLELKIYELKKNGEWKALNDLIRESMPGGAEEAWKVIEQQQRNADVKVEQAKLELARGLSEQQRLIQQRSQWFGKMETAIESFKMQHLNDSVSHYYEILTKAAPTNWEYLNKAGVFERQYMADNNRAMKYCLSALNMAKSDTLKAICYNSVGMIYSDQGENVKALDYYEKSLRIRLSVYGESHPYVATCYNNVGVIYSTYGEHAKALDYYEKSLRIYLSVYGESHPYVALTYDNIGGIYSTQGEYAKAMDYYERSLKIYFSVYGENHPYVALTYNNIGLVYSDQGEYGKAMDYYERSLKIYFFVYGENHPYVASSYNNIGLIYSNQGGHAEALDYYEKSLRICFSVYGENHPDVANCYNNIGVVYSNQGEHAKALDYFEKSLKISLSVYGENHPYVATCYNSIGAIYFAQGKHAKAMDYYERSLRIRLSVYGENHPNVALNYRNIGLIYSTQGEYAKALDYNERSLRIRLSVYGENHPDVALIYNDIGFIYLAQGDYGKALISIEKSLVIRRKIFGENHSSTKETLAQIGYITYCQAQQCHETAIRFMQTHIVTGSITGNSPASERGMLGEYVILGYGEWTINTDTINIYDINNRMRGYPKTLVFYKDGQIRQEYFENAIGMLLQVHPIDKQEKEKIISCYKTWLISNKNEKK